MIFTPLFLEGSFRIELEPKHDDRGYFERIFCVDEFAAESLETQWLQQNRSFSTLRGTLRGLHFQRPPTAEVKLVHCPKGSIWDVIVDLRANSPTYGQWHGEILNEHNHSMLYVPRGYAHGFQSLTNDAEIHYLVSEKYSPEHESGLVWNDPDVAIDWPLEVSIQSQRDRELFSLQSLDPIAL